MYFVLLHDGILHIIRFGQPKLPLWIVVYFQKCCISTFGANYSYAFLYLHKSTCDTMINYVMLQMIYHTFDIVAPFK